MSLMAMGVFILISGLILAFGQDIIIVFLRGMNKLRRFKGASK